MAFALFKTTVPKLEESNKNCIYHLMSTYCILYSRQYSRCVLSVILSSLLLIFVEEETEAERG